MSLTLVFRVFHRWSHRRPSFASRSAATIASFYRGRGTVPDTTPTPRADHPGPAGGTGRGEVESLNGVIGDYAIRLNRSVALEVSATQDIAYLRDVLHKANDRAVAAEARALALEAALGEVLDSWGAWDAAENEGPFTNEIWGRRINACREFTDAVKQARATPSEALARHDAEVREKALGGLAALRDIWGSLQYAAPEMQAHWYREMNEALDALAGGTP